VIRCERATNFLYLLGFLLHLLRGHFHHIQTSTGRRPAYLFTMKEGDAFCSDTWWCDAAAEHLLPVEREG